MAAVSAGMARDPSHRDDSGAEFGGRRGDATIPSSGLIDAVSDPTIDNDNDTRPQRQKWRDDEDRQSAGPVQSRADRPNDEPKDGQQPTFLKRQPPRLQLIHARIGTPYQAQTEGALLPRPRRSAQLGGARGR